MIHVVFLRPYVFQSFWVPLVALLMRFQAVLNSYVIITHIVYSLACYVKLHMVVFLLMFSEDAYSDKEFHLWAVAFSADSQQFAVATTHGVFVFSQDAAGGGIYGEARFVPQMLTKAVSAPAVLKALEEQDMSRAMILALALNDRGLLRKVYEQVPVDSIDLVVASIGSPLLPALIAFLGLERLYRILGRKMAKA